MSKPLVACYVCSAPNTSVEHVPPRRLFIKSKDLPPGVDPVNRIASACNASSTTSLIMVSSSTVRKIP